MPQSYVLSGYTLQYLGYLNVYGHSEVIWCISSLLRSTTSCFGDKRLSEIGNAPNDFRMTLSTYPSRVSCIHDVIKVPLRAKFCWFISLYDQLFSRYKVVESRPKFVRRG